MIVQSAALEYKQPATRLQRTPAPHSILDHFIPRQTATDRSHSARHVAGFFPALAAPVTLRVRSGITQTELARRVGTSQPRIAQIEAAQANVTVDTLDRIAAAFSVQTAALFKRPSRRSPAEPAAHAP